MKIFPSRMPKPFVHITYIIILLYVKTKPLLLVVKLQAESKIVFSNYTIAMAPVILDSSIANWYNYLCVIMCVNLIILQFFWKRVRGGDELING